MKYEHIFINKNTGYEKEIQILDSEGVIVDLTNYTTFGYLAKHYESATVYTMTVAVLDAINGIIRINLSDDLTATYPVGTNVYSIFIKPSGGENILVSQGNAIVNPTVYIAP